MKRSKKDFVLLVIFSVLAIAINAFIIYHSCLNANQSTEASSFVVDVFKNIINAFKANTINDNNYGDFANVIRKLIGHFGLFMVSGVLSSLAFYYLLKPYKWYKHYFAIIISFVFGFIIASITEIIQLSVPGRSGEFTDVLIDSGGYLLGLGIASLILLLILKNKQNARENTNNQ